MIVLDASVCAPWFLPDETSELSNKAARYPQSSSVAVPLIWPCEIRNIVLMTSRRKRIGREAFSTAIAEIAAIQLVIDPDPDWSRISALAMHHGLTVYDASYLELAERRSLTLATLDRRLAAAAQAEGVPLLA